MKTGKLCSLIMCLFSGILFSQNKILDSLFNALKYPVNDSAGIRTLSSIGKAFRQLDTDSSISYHKQALRLAEKKSSDFLIVESLKDLGIDYYYIAEYDSSLLYLQKALNGVDGMMKDKMIKPEKITFYRSMMHSNIALVYFGRSDFPRSMEHNLRALKYSEEINDLKTISNILNNMAGIYVNQEDYAKALMYYQEVLKTDKSLGNIDDMALAYGNIGVVYDKLKQQDKALENYTKAVQLSIETGNKQNLAMNYQNLGVLHLTNADSFSVMNVEARQTAETYRLAEDYLTKALALYEEIDDRVNMPAALANLANLKISLKQYDQAEKLLKNSLRLSENMGALEEMTQAHDFLSKLYEATNRPGLSLKHYKEHVRLRDSIYSEENTRKSISQEYKFSYEKKAAADSLKAAEENLVVAARLENEKNQRYILYGGLSLVFVFAGFMVNRYYVTERQKRIIEEQKNVTEAQKNIVDAKQAEILASIQSARQIQNTLLPSDQYVTKSLERLNGK